MKFSGGQHLCRRSGVAHGFRVAAQAIGQLVEEGIGIWEVADFHGAGGASAEVGWADRLRACACQLRLENAELDKKLRNFDALELRLKHNKPSSLTSLGHPLPTESSSSKS
jgi:hypothetical protein